MCKKRIAIVFSMVIAVLFCAVFIQLNIVFAQEWEGITQKLCDISGSYTSSNFEMYSEEEKKLLYLLLSKIEENKYSDRESEVVIVEPTWGLSLDDCYKVVSYFYLYYGDRDAIDTVFKFYTLLDNAVVVIDYNAARVLEEKLDEIKDEIDNILLSFENGSEEYMLYQISEYLRENITYTAGKYTLYDAVLFGESTCNGYALSFNFLANRLGIQSDICIGEVDESYHAWNKVVLSDGSEYFYDITFFDADEGNIKYIHSFYPIYTEDYLLNSYVKSWFK